MILNAINTTSVSESKCYHIAGKVTGLT